MHYAARAMIDTEVAFVGLGTVGETLMKGLLSANTLSADKVRASHPREDRRREIAELYGAGVHASNSDAVQGAGLVVLCVKPQIFPHVVEEMAPALAREALVVSIVAGVPISAIEKRLGNQVRVVRAMPNLPCLVGAGASVLAAGSQATSEDTALAERIFASVGETIVVEEEDLIDAATGLSGSGPSYVFLLIEALADGGVKMGLSRDRSLRLAAQTVYGAAKLVIETGEHPGRLKDMVTSPGGTAIAGIHTLEAGGLRTTLINAVEAATLRARELGITHLNGLE